MTSGAAVVSPVGFLLLDLAGMGFVLLEATATLKRIASRLATKWWQPYSKTCGYVKSRVAITLVLSTHCCLHGSRVTAHWIRVQRTQREDGAGLKLFR